MQGTEQRRAPILRAAVYALAFLWLGALALWVFLAGPALLDCDAGDGVVVRSCFDARVSAFARGGVSWTLPFALLAALHGRRRGALILAAGAGAWMFLHARFLVAAVQALMSDRWG